MKVSWKTFIHIEAWVILLSAWPLYLLYSFEYKNALLSLFPLSGFLSLFSFAFNILFVVSSLTDPYLLLSKDKVMMETLCLSFVCVWVSSGAGPFYLLWPVVYLAIVSAFSVSGVNYRTHVETESRLSTTRMLSICCRLYILSENNLLGFYYHGVPDSTKTSSRS